MGLSGYALIQCIVSPQGALHDCQVLKETPAGAGFGQAALALTPQFLMRPETVNGKPVEATISIPITFKGPPSGTVVPTVSPPPSGTRIPRPDNRNNGLVVTGLTWLQAPTYAQVVEAYPAKAREARVGGHVDLNCRLDIEGRPDWCEVLAEAPRGDGFGEAARKLIHDFRGPLTDGNGASIRGASVQIPFVFAPEMLADGQPTIGKPQWVHLPEAVDMAAAFPAQAVAAHVSVGHVALACDVTDGGRLTSCAVTRQEPDGMGFDKAALALAPSFQVSVWTDEGLPTVGGRIGVPIRYEAGTPADQTQR
jgi:TonB family protein